MRARLGSVLLCLVVASCTTSPDGPIITRTVGASHPPELSTELSVYQKPGATNLDSLLAAFLNAQILVVDIWNPLGGSPCRAMCASENVIVRLVYPDWRMREHGFDSDPGWMCINCGIDQFEHYHVQR